MRLNFLATLALMTFHIQTTSMLSATVNNGMTSQHWADFEINGEMRLISHHWSPVEGSQRENQRKWSFAVIFSVATTALTTSSGEGGENVCEDSESICFRIATPAQAAYLIAALPSGTHV